MITPSGVPLATAAPARLDLDVAAPGERYFRHPGDVLRLVLWGLITLLLALFVSVGRLTDAVDADVRAFDAERRSFVERFTAQA